MPTIKKHKNGEVSIRISRDLAQRIALSMSEVYEKCATFDDWLDENDLRPVNSLLEASDLHHELNAKVWR